MHHHHHKHHGHHHHHKHHHHHIPTIVFESKPIVQETVIVQTQQQPVFVQKPTTTIFPTPTVFAATPTFTTPTFTMPTQTYTMPTYIPPTMTTMTPTYTTPTYPTTTTIYPSTTTTPTTTFDPTKHPYFRGALGLSTKYFSDQSLLSKYNNDHKIAIISIAHNGKACTGLSAQYYVGSQNLTVKGDLHYGTAHPYGGKDESVLLDIDEYIVEIFGKQSKWIDSLGFKTNKGRIVEYGGQTGFFFNVVAPPGYHFSGLAGGIGEHLDYITFEVASIPVKQTFIPPPTTTTMTMGLQTGGMQQMPTYQGFQPSYKQF